MMQNIKSLKDRLREAMEIKGIKVPALSKHTGIPKDRIYAWYRDNTDPKSKDAELLEKWLAGEKPPENGGNERTKLLGQVPAEDLIQVLKEHNEFLRRNFETSLINLMEGQQAASAHLKTLLRYNVEVANKEDPKRAEQDLIKVHNMLAFYAGVGGEEGNFHTDSSKSTSGQRKDS